MSLYTDASLIMYPSGYKEDKIYSLKPTDGSGDLTFTRASTATRVNADGLIETSPVNLALYSEQFDNAAWGKLASVSITANATTSPNGTTTADYVTFSSSGTTTQLYQVITAQAIITQSLYIKYISGTGTGIRLSNGSDINYGLNLEFTNSGATLTGTAGTNVISYEIVNVGNNWFRVSLTYSYTNPEFNLYRYTGTGSDVYAIYGAQLNIGATAKPYFPTTDRLNVPRIDYTSGCGKLLLEPQRTNLVTYSNAFNFWTLSGDGVGQSQTSNYAISPDGTNNATRLQLNKTGGTFSRLSLSNTGTIGGAGIAYTIYLKANIGTSNVYIQSGPNISSAINVTSEWTRYEIIGNASGGTTTCVIGIADSVSGTSETADILIYGAQLENGSYSTSLINTSGTAVTRLADSCSMTGISDKIGQTEGTLFAEVNFTDTNVDQTYVIISDGTSNNQISIGWSNALNALIAFIRTGGSSQALMTLVSPASGVKKIAVGYKLNNCALYINGVLVASDSSAIMPACSRVDIGGTFTAGSEYPINQALLFPTRLTNTQLATLTTI